VDSDLKKSLPPEIYREQANQDANQCEPGKIYGFFPLAASEFCSEFQSKKPSASLPSVKDLEQPSFPHQINLAPGS
jgi:hypothetical protein